MSCEDQATPHCNIGKIDWTCWNMRTAKPPMMGWEITRRCNLTCPHCFTAATVKDSPEFSTEECRAIIDQLVALGVQRIGWTGGEPLLREDLEELIVYACETGSIQSGITTNGVLLDETRARTLKQAGAASIQISLDGSTAKHNFAIRRAGEEEFEKVLEAIRVCKRLRIKFNLAMVLSRATIDDAPEYLELARREGAREVRFCGFVPTGRGKARAIRDGMAFNDERGGLRQFVSKCVEPHAFAIGFDQAFGPLPPDYWYHSCCAGVKFFYLSSTGDVYPCTSLIDRRFVVGNVRERSLEQLWNDPGMVQMAAMPRKQITGKCRACELFSKCRGGCRGVAYSYTGDLYASFPVCMKP